MRTRWKTACGCLPLVPRALLMALIGGALCGYCYHTDRTRRRFFANEVVHIVRGLDQAHAVAFVNGFLQHNPSTVAQVPTGTRARA